MWCMDTYVYRRVHIYIDVNTAGAGGDLVLCDTEGCPNAYHPECIPVAPGQPQLTMHSLPEGEWHCPCCEATMSQCHTVTPAEEVEPDGAEQQPAMQCGGAEQPGASHQQPGDAGIQRHEQPQELDAMYL